MEGGIDRERIRNKNEFERIHENSRGRMLEGLGSGNNNWMERIWREDSIMRNLAGFR
jgi:hypothetical protein